jgi:hypothetical protein
MARYSYHLLAAVGGTNAERNNADILGDLTLGIEVTEPDLAARCGLGNIDPQHDGSGSGLSAIEAAALWPLPPNGARFATIRPDLDAFGAMALLTYRADGLVLTPPVKARIDAVARADRFDRGPWPGRQPMPRSSDDLMVEVRGDDIGIVSAAMKDATVPASERVQIAKAWLSRGIIPKKYERVPHERAARLFQALEKGDVLVDEKRAPGSLIEIVSATDGALQLGYRFAPIVIVLNPAFAFRDGSVGQKFTVAQYCRGYADLDKAMATIATWEDGWGGSATIKGSPQGRPSCLSRERVAAAVAAAMQEAARHEANESTPSGA